MEIRDRQEDGEGKREKKIMVFNAKEKKSILIMTVAKKKDTNEHHLSCTLLMSLSWKAVYICVYMYIYICCRAGFEVRLRNLNPGLANKFLLGYQFSFW